MAEKISMLMVEVDLDCHKCYNKMRKILCKLQDREGIRTISFDDKSKTIAIAGPFNPKRLECKIRCMGRKVVKDIQIIDVGGGGNGNGKPPPPVNNNGRKKQNKEKPPDAAEPPPTHPPPPPAPPPEMPHTPPAMKPRSPMPCPRPPEQYPPADCVIPPVGPCCAPCYLQEYYEGCRCGCGEGRMYGCAATRPLPYGYRGCRIINEEDPNAACSIM